MLAPAQRLLWLVVGLLPVLLAQAFVPALGWLSLVLALILVAVAVYDAWTLPAMAGKVVITPDACTRLTRTNVRPLRLRIAHPLGGLRLRLALDVPHGLIPEPVVLEVTTAADRDATEVEWPIKGMRRGVWPLTRVRVEVRSPGRLWRHLRDEPVQAEIRVYPNLSRDHTAMASLFLNRGDVGQHLQRMVGKGREFDKLREYLPGDTFQDIHWKSTAKLGKPVTKQYQVERTQEIYVLLDTSRLGGQPLPRQETEEWPETGLERGVTAASILALMAERSGDSYGVITFSDRVHHFLRASSGPAQRVACQDVLFAVQPEPVVPDFEEVITFVRLHLKRRSLLILITDLRDPVAAETFEARIGMLSRQYIVLAFMIQRDGVEPVFKGAAPESAAGLYQRIAGHLQWRQIAQLKRRLAAQQVTLVATPEERLVAQIGNRYLEVKRRQLL